MGKKKKTKKAGFDGELFLERLLYVSGFRYQKEIADDCGINTTSFSRMINGSQEISLDDLMLFANKYHCSIDYLLGLGESISVSDYELTSFAEIIRVFSALFDKGVFKVSAGSDVEFCNDIFPFLWDEVKRMKRNVINGNNRKEDFETWLKGFCLRFDYLFPNLETLQDLEKDFERMKETFGFDDSAKLFKSYADWKKECDDNGVSFKSELDSFSAYADDVFCFFDSRGVQASPLKDTDGISYVWGKLKTADKEKGFLY